jgi:pimeloyl-ACP methyl ester carboxylesterase
MVHRKSQLLIGLSLLVVFLGLAAGTGCDSDASPGPALDLGTPAVFAPVACPMSSSSLPMECGTITVPESRAAGANGKTVTLFMVKLKSRSTMPAPDPLIYLEGGPGGSSVDTVLVLAGIGGGPLAPILAKRDVIAIDQRGTGRSLPSLQCPELADGELGMLGGTMAMSALTPLDLLTRCRARLAGEGIDLASYRTSESADDLASARIALGHAQWNVLSASYGTRLALELMRRHPEGIRSVVLDSVWPADVDLIAESGPNFMRAMDLLFAGCSAQPTCEAAYPNLRQVLLDVVTGLDSKPFPIATPTGTLMLTGKIFASVLTRFLYAPITVRDIPELIFQLHDANYGVFQQAFGMMMDASAGEAISMGLHYSVMCADALPLTSTARIEERAATLPPALKAPFTLGSYPELCQAWNVPPSPAGALQPVGSGVPTLVLSGQIDPVTPPDWGKHAAETLTHNVRFELTGEGHGIFLTSCGSQLLGAYLADPTQPPPASCVANERALVFKTYR